MQRLVIDAADTVRALDAASRNVPRAATAFMRSLAIQTQRGAVRRSSGPSAAPAGAYPIPVRTGTHRRAFGIEVDQFRAVVFNAGIGAQALHDGFRPYGNPHTRPIPARPYFDDALDDLDLDVAQAAADKALESTP